MGNRWEESEGFNLMEVTTMDNKVLDPKLDSIIDVFSSCRRRCIIYHFLASDERIASIEELCDHILEYDPGAHEEENVMMELHHKTLPALSRKGFIEYDTRSGAVRFQKQDIGERLAACIQKIEINQ